MKIVDSFLYLLYNICREISEVNDMELNVFYASEDINERVYLLECMNNVVINLVDESFYYDSWVLVVPDGADKDDFITIAEDDTLFDLACKTFMKIMKKAC